MRISDWSSDVCSSDLLKADGGIMITGSHNPPDYNGFKMMIGTRPFFGKDIQSLGPIAAEGAYAEGEGSVEDVDLLGTYTDRLLKDYRPGKPLTVVWDCGNGATGPVRSEEHTSERQSLMRISYAVFCLKKNTVV